MKLEGRVYKDGNFWLVEVPAVAVMTQGYTKKDAYFMIVDAIEMLIDKKGFKMHVEPGPGEKFYVVTDQIKPLLALMLQRQRDRHHLTLAEMAKKLKVKSLNAYAQYEQARSEPSLSQLQKFISAMGPDSDFILEITH